MDFQRIILSIWFSRGFGVICTFAKESTLFFGSSVFGSLTAPLALRFLLLRHRLLLLPTAAPVITGIGREVIEKLRGLSA